METITVRRTFDRPLRFRGEQLWQFETSPNNASPRYSGRTGRWERLVLYETNNHRYVLAVAQYTLWQGESDVFDALVFNNLDEVAAYLKDECPIALQEFCELFDVYEEL